VAISKNETLAWAAISFFEIPTFQFFFVFFLVIPSEYPPSIKYKD
jgi:hypothetical protein